MPATFLRCASALDLSFSLGGLHVMDDADLLFRRVLLTGGPTDIPVSRQGRRAGFLSHLRSLKGYDEPEILHSSKRQIRRMGDDVGHFWDLMDRVFCSTCITAFYGRYDLGNPALVTCLEAIKRRRKTRPARARFSDEQQILYTQERAYLQRVRALSKVRLRQNYALLNPHNRSFGWSGKKGAYHLDHIVPLQVCWQYRVSEEDAASVQNLQVVPWLLNILRTPSFRFDRLVGRPRRTKSIS